MGKGVSSDRVVVKGGHVEVLQRKEHLHHPRVRESVRERK